MPILKFVSFQYTHTTTSQFNVFQHKNAISLQKTRDTTLEVCGAATWILKLSCFEQSRSLSPPRRGAVIPQPSFRPSSNSAQFAVPAGEGTELLSTLHCHVHRDWRKHNLQDITFGIWWGPGYQELWQDVELWAESTTRGHHGEAKAKCWLGALGISKD